MSFTADPENVHDLREALLLRFMRLCRVFLGLCSQPSVHCCVSVPARFLYYSNEI
jgi:hypothetical protein